MNFTSTSSLGLRLGQGTSTDSATIDVVNGGNFNFAADGGISFYSGTDQIIVRTGGALTKSAGAGTSTISANVNTLGGTVSVTSGTLSLTGGGNSVGGTFTSAAPGGILLASNTFQYDGTLLNNVTQSGGTIDGPGNVMIRGFNWSSGYMQGAGKTIVVTGTPSAITGSNSCYLVRTLEVDGTMNLSSTSSLALRMGGGTSTDTATVDVVNGGLFAFTADGGVSQYSGTTQFVVRTGGLLTKSGGTLTSSINCNVNTMGGTVSATAGVFALAGGGNSVGGTFLSTSPGVVSLTSNTFQYDGTLLDGVTLNGGTIDGPGNVNIKGFNWAAGTMRGTGKTIAVAGAASAITGSNSCYLGRTLEVSGTMNVSSTSSLALRMGLGTSTDVATVDIVNGGVFAFTADGGVNQYSGTTQFIVRTGGTLTKSAGAATSSIGCNVNTVGGVISATSGILGLAGGGNSVGGTLLSTSPGIVSLTSNTFLYNNTLLDGVTLNGATIDGPGNVNIKGFNWANGYMRGTGKTFVVAGTPSVITGSNSCFLGRTLEVDGTLNITSNSSLALRMGVGNSDDVNTVDIVNGGTLNFTIDGGISQYSGDSKVFVRAGGTLAKTGGTGISTIGVVVNNTGTVRAQVKTLALSSVTNVGDGTFLSSGDYFVSTGATLTFSTPITTLTADIEIDGTGSVPQLTGLLINRGRIGLTGGADITLPTTNPARLYTQEGILDLSPDSIFTVNGSMKFAGVSQPVIRTELASATSFGKVVVTGTIDLDSLSSTSRFDPDLVGTYDPAIGATHAVIVANGGITNAFDSFQGGATPSGNILLVNRPNANTLSVNVGPGPLPPAPQILSQSFEYETRVAIVFQFNQDVSAFLSRKDYSIGNTDTNLPLAQSIGTLSYNQTSNQATLILTNVIPDGNYKLTVNAGDIANAAGVPASGSPITINFFVLAGDANRDKKVGFDDLLIVAQNYNTSGHTFTAGNLDYSTDGKVDFSDLLILAQQYGKALALTAELPKPALAAKKRNDLAADLAM